MDMATNSSLKPRYQATLAVINVARPVVEVLQQCFRQCRIDTQASSPSVEQLQTSAFDACAIRLDAGAEAYLQALRAADGNRRCLVYGFGSIEEALRLSEYGVNCLFEGGAGADAIAREVENTYLLLLRQLRRYVRLPLITGMKAVTPHRGTLTGVTREISGGGLSAYAVEGLAVADTAQLLLGLPGLSGLEIPAVVCWCLETQRTTGFQFRPCNDRLRLKAWIDGYLGME
ncbi:MAG TPA: PilZ domain-containing protein [Terriglobales bacterium]|nr:PilZ domain-containing protein [Terriglobales bacterium]